MVLLEVDFTSTFNLKFDMFRKGIDDRNPNSVQSARNLVGSAVKFPSGMEFGEHDLSSGHSLSFHYICRNAPAIVFDCDAIIYVDSNTDACAKPSQCFVYRVINNLENKVMESSL